MTRFTRWTGVVLMATLSSAALAQEAAVRIQRSDLQKKVDVLIGGKLFTTLMYTDTLEKPVLYPLMTAGGIPVTRGFPLDPKPGDPTDHPHHLGLWFNFENVNGLDFWNNSYAIAAGRKAQYGWIRTDSITEIKSGKIGVLAYHANWTNQEHDILLEERTRFEFSGTGFRRVLDRTTTLKAAQDVTFTDAKDGMLGLRLAHELQMPAAKAEQFRDSKGIVTTVKGDSGKMPTGNYLSSAGKTGDAVWGTRAIWCKVFGKIGTDSVSIAIIDHPQNPNYPTFWHARGYGLFAANPLGEKVFTNGTSAKNLTLKKGQSVTFSYRVVISNGTATLSPAELNVMADNFAKK